MLRKLLIFYVKLSYQLVNGSLAFLALLLFKKSIQPAKILVQRNGSIGDSITSFPAIAALKQKFPNAQIDILTNSGSQQFVGMESLLDSFYYSRIINYFGWSKKKQYQEIRQNNYDLFVNLSQDKTTWFLEFRRLLFIKYCGIPSAIGFEVGTVKVLLKFQNKFMRHLSERARLLKILKPLSIEGVKEEFPIPYLAAESEKISVLYPHIFNSSTKNIGLVIGAKRVQNKWPESHWEKLIDKCLSKRIHIYLIGGQDDQILASRLSKSLVTNTCGKLTILETAALIKHLDLVVSNDTGPMHLSYAMHTPVIGLFSAWQLQNVWYPPHENNEVFIKSDLSCAPCYSNSCTFNACMHAILPEHVFESVTKRLELNS
jgi:heptosyltransferase-2